MALCRCGKTGEPSTASRTTEKYRQMCDSPIAGAGAYASSGLGDAAAAGDCDIMTQKPQGHREGGAQDVHFDFHTAPELWNIILVFNPPSPQRPSQLSVCARVCVGAHVLFTGIICVRSSVCVHTCMCA